MSVDLLLDTSYVIWFFGGHQRGEVVRDLLEDPTSTVTVSAVTWSEVAIKHSIGKLQGDVGALRAAAREFGVLELDWTGNHAESLARLPLHHRDPFDRMLIAQALAEDIDMLSSDAAFTAYEGLRIHGA
jgi:PIN domain nuclease of toxin-antitoxin system